MKVQKRGLCSDNHLS